MILHTLLHQTTTTVNQWAGMDFPYLIYIDGTTAITPLAYLSKASPFKCLAHTFGC